jgi:hypothetical protein
MLKQKEDPEFVRKSLVGLEDRLHKAHEVTREKMRDPANRKVMSILAKEAWEALTEEEKNKKRTVLRGWMSKLKEKDSGYTYTSKDGRKIHIRSRHELVVAYGLDYIGLPWEHEVDFLHYKVGEEEHVYIPDFSTPRGLIEVKIDWLAEKDKRWPVILATFRPTVMNLDVLTITGLGYYLNWMVREKINQISYTEIYQKPKRSPAYGQISLESWLQSMT